MTKAREKLLASNIDQALPIDAALVPLPGAPAALASDFNRDQQFEKRLQAVFAQHGMPQIDSERLSEVEREDLAWEKDSDTADQDYLQIKKSEAGQAFALDANPISRE